MSEEKLERELKFACAELNSLRERLLDAEAERRSASALEDNLVFDRNDELRAAGTLLRLRRDAHGARLTFKGAASFDGGVKVREERETALDDGDEMERILERLGFSVEHRYQKYREEWQLGGVIVCLDRTPIGTYVEFEGDGAGKLARRFGFDVAAAERRTYLEIYEDHRRSDPSAPRDMVFP
jgi:adenylate cyclase class 2